jgi:hypothetical protein
MAFDHHISSLRRYTVFLLRCAVAVLVVAGHWNIARTQGGSVETPNAGPEYVQLDPYLLPQAQTPVPGKQSVDAQPLSVMVPACAVIEPEALGKITIGIASWGIDPPVTTHLIAALSASSGL